MKIIDLINEINKEIEVPQNTTDVVMAGDTEREVKRVGVTMTPTVDVIRQCIDNNIDFLIVHEPEYFCLDPDSFPLTVFKEKKKLIEDSGLTVYRYHDHAHCQKPDLITVSGLNDLGIDAKITDTPYYASYIIELEKGVTALELADKMQKDLKIAHPRICGSREKECKKIAVCFGTPGGVYELLLRDDIDMVLTGEAGEGSLCEYARDADALGHTKSLIVMGHIGSERMGMKRLACELKNDSRFETVYIESKEVYTYCD